MARLIDTAVFIELERSGRPLSVLPAQALDERFALASITIAELLVGAEKATDRRRQRRYEFVTAVLAAFPVVPFDVLVARVHARLWAELDRQGRRIGPYDLLIAATAVTYGYEVVAFNTGEFGRVSGLGVRRSNW